MTKLFGCLPGRVRVVEVGPRDGLQNQEQIVPVETKAEWVARLARAGLPEIEVTSFVHPKWVPQLADAPALFAMLPRDTPALFSALVPNRKGLDLALASGVRRIALFTAASETFAQKNINCSIEESFDRFREVFDAIAGSDVHVRAYLSTAFGCPYEGAVEPRRVAELSRRLFEAGAREIAISDTTGVASPAGVEEVVEQAAALIPRAAIALHFHDTRGLAAANVLVGLQLGITTFDASGGGLGGCPFAPGAAGNLATEDLVHLLHALGIETGIDLNAVVGANLWFETHFAAPFPGRVLAVHRRNRRA
ncbi:MAG: hydroxymethylglutaryl-CoA lyase [Planctomycetes bacterium]|nr:hydroxymethylglutaryl-CoA lyase [Planctomycetota bacterium]